MLMSIFRAFVNNLFYKNFDTILWKMKKTIKTLIIFFLIKTFFNWIVNKYFKSTRYYDPNNNNNNNNNNEEVELYLLKHVYLASYFIWIELIFETLLFDKNSCMLQQSRDSQHSPTE